MKTKTTPITRFSAARLRTRVVGYTIRHKVSIAAVARLCFPNAKAPAQAMQNLMSGQIGEPEHRTLERIAGVLGCEFGDLREPEGKP